MPATGLDWGYSPEAEQSLLGALLLDGSAIDAVTDAVDSTDFYTEDHAAIFRTVVTMRGASEAIDIATVAERLAREAPEALAATGGAAYLAQLAQATPSALNIRRYAELVRERAVCRRLHSIGLDLSLSAKERGSRSASELVAQARARIDTLAQSARPRHALRALSAADFIGLELPELEPLLPPWLLRKNLCMVHAKRGVGKTYFCLSLAYAVATGASFLGWRADRPRGVLYIDGEVQAQVMQRRLRELSGMFGHAPAQLRLLSPDVQEKPMPDLATREGQAEIDAMLTDEIGLIVLDNLSCLVRSGGAENESDSWTWVADWLLKLRRAGLAVVIVHHSGKSGAQRGTSKREDLLDVVINLRRPGDYQDADGARFEVHFEKARSLTGEDIAPIEARLQDGPGGALAWTHSSAATKTQDRIRALWDGGTLTLTDVVKEVGCSKSHAHETLKRAQDAGELARQYPAKSRSKSYAT